jgi:hypothetical protein
MRHAAGFGIAALALVMVAVTSTALAQTLPRPGLWRNTMVLNGIPGMTDGMNQEMIEAMANMTPEMRAQMESFGIEMPNFSADGNSVGLDVCMTAEDIAAAQAYDLAGEYEDCTISNVQQSGNTVTGDFTCTGEGAGTGDFTYVYDSDVHFTGSVNYTGTYEGIPVQTSQTMTGDWVSADCGDVAP